MYVLRRISWLKSVLLKITVYIPFTRLKRKRKEPNALKEYVVTTTTGQECDDEQTDTSVKVFWRRTAYMAVIDTTLANLKYRFSNDSLKLANSIDSFCKMDYNNGLYFIEHYKVNLS